MGYGMAFFIGVLAGLILGIVITALILSRRRNSQANVGSGDAKAAAPGILPRGDGRQEAASPKMAGVDQPNSKLTVIIEKIDADRDDQLDRNVQDVRETVIRLANIVSIANAASDKAAAAFSSAKSAIGANPVGRSANIGEIKTILITEVDRLLKSNSHLKGELEKSRESIAAQRQQIEILRERTRIDSLTNIPNRAAFDERLRECLASFERSSRVFTLLILDIDFFKKINDTLGHVNGDRILRGVAAKIATSARTNDFIARYGGEEFMVIFPETDLREAMLGAERIRSGVANANFSLDAKKLKVTISGGLAESAPGMTSEEIIAAADKGLYFSKQNGRNQISCAAG